MSESKRASAEHFERPMSPDDIGWDPDDAPELDDEWFERADLSVAGKLVQRGYRPGETERLVLPTEIVDHGRTRKVIAFKKRRRQNSRRKRGHRQDHRHD